MTKRILLSFVVFCFAVLLIGCQTVSTESSVTQSSHSTSEESSKSNIKEEPGKTVTSDELSLDKNSPNPLMSAPMKIKKYRSNAMEGDYACIFFDSNSWETLTQEQIREFALAVSQKKYTTMTIDLLNGYAYNFTPTTIDLWQYGDYDTHTNNRYEIKNVIDYYIFEDGVYRHVPLNYESR